VGEDDGLDALYEDRNGGDAEDSDANPYWLDGEDEDDMMEDDGMEDDD
jgi:hypothetical protein